MANSNSPKELSPSDKSLASQASTINSTYNNESSQPIPEGKITLMAVAMGVCASIGGFLFGYEAGQIGGLFSCAT